MPDLPYRLTEEHEPGLSALLDRNPTEDLFLRGFLASNAVERAWWYGVGEPLRAAILVLPARLAVPCAMERGDAALLGRHLRVQHRPCLLVGPREASDTLWAAWAPGHSPRRRHDQRLYVLERTPPGHDPPGFRLAAPADAEQVSVHGGAMELEDLGTDPRAADPRQHLLGVTDRIRAGRVFVIDDPAGEGRLAFQVAVGTLHHDGAQVGGTYVPPALRGRGFGVAGVAATCRALLRAVPRVTLHVNEANHPAVRCYERVGFSPSTALRLVVP